MESAPETSLAPRVFITMLTARPARPVHPTALIVKVKKSAMSALMDSERKSSLTTVLLPPSASKSAVMARDSSLNAMTETLGMMMVATATVKSKTAGAAMEAHLLEPALVLPSSLTDPTLTPPRLFICSGELSKESDSLTFPNP